MIIYRKQPFDFKMKNIIVLDAGLTDGYIYVNKETYEQAVALGVTFSKDHERIEKALGKSIDGWKITPGIFTAFRKASEALPSPINMLATFIGLATDAEINWQVDGEELCETVCGVLHTISQFADFYAMSLVPAEQRTKLDIPKHIYKGYKESWEDIVSELDSKVLCIDESKLNDIIKEYIANNDTHTGLSNMPAVNNVTAVQASIDETQIRDIVDKRVDEKISLFITNELPKLLQQNMGSMNAGMMGMFNPYQQQVMANPYQQQMFQQPVMNLSPTPIPVPQPNPTPIPVPQSNPAPIPIQQPTPVVTNSTHVQVLAADDKADFIGGEVDIVEGENVVDPNEILAIFKQVEEKHDELLEKEKEKLVVKEKAPNKEPVTESFILTEDVRKEKGIAEESIKIINSYDI